ncbi:MAG: YifB family Mg chelatase-like AAA ATPase [Cellvibrionaceae bacterium]
MSLSIGYTRAHLGMEAPLVTVETHLSNGLPAFNIVGLPETAVKESKDRVRSALINSQFEFPQRRITVNLAPADLPKAGGRYDLAIAAGILAASGQIPAKALHNCELLGELALSGEVRAVGGTLPAAIAACNQERSILLSNDDAQQAALSKQAQVFSASHLLQVAQHLSGQQTLPFTETQIRAEKTSIPDLADVKGQPRAKRALEIAAAGNHNIIFYGPPGTGKTMLASRLPGILPTLNEQSMLEVAALYDLSQVKRDNIWLAPFRSPHHSSSTPALVGGGSNPKPGEISLAHKGVLFLDELPEFQRPVIECLREPLESGEVMIARANARCRFPAQFQLVAAMNPTRHGNSSSDDMTGEDIQATRRYWSKLSAPFLDRIDIQVEVTRPPKEALISSDRLPPEEPSETIAARVKQARETQQQRQQKLNDQLTPDELLRHCQLGIEEQTLMEKAVDKLGLSARATHRILRTARTIADLEEETKVTLKNLREAISFRGLDRHPALKQIQQ